MTSFGVEFFYVYVERVLKMYLPNHKKTLLVKRFAGSWKELSLPELNQNAKISVTPRNRKVSSTLLENLSNHLITRFMVYHALF